MSAPAAEALEQAAQERAASGTENRGFLSEEQGLLPVRPPSARLPDSHRVWDETAARLPELFRSVRGREVLAAIPCLPAGADALPDGDLLRAASLLSHFAHVYVRVRPDPPDGLPECITVPWGEVCRRLGRDQVVLTYDDLVSNNWRLLDPGDPVRRLDNLAVLTPTVANGAERIFYMVQVEVLARTGPAIGAMARAQDAMLAQDEEALCRELALLIDVLDEATRSFLKIDANPHSPTYVDPVVWAKTVAPFAVAIEQGHHAVSGAAAPIFQVIDVFIGRKVYESRVGREAALLRPGFSPNLRSFMDALAAFPVCDAVPSGSPRLRGLWHALLEAYSGDRGFLGVHRRKAYAFLEVAFKVGRSVTTGGFSGLFDDQTWDVADRELEASRRERWKGADAWCPVAHAVGTGPLAGDGLAHVRLDVVGAGVRYRPGDRLAIQPRNTPELVELTIRALRATGETPVRLDRRWRAATGAETLPLRELLQRGRIRPVARDGAKALLAFSESDRLARVVGARAESAFELWDLLELMGEGGFDPRALLRADPWEPYSLARLVPPETFRLYSLASAMDDGPAAHEVELVAAELRYTDWHDEHAAPRERAGTASAFLRRIRQAPEGAPLAVRMVPASRFRPPDDSSRPVIMFAGGAGFSPFRAFVGDRLRQPDTGLTWLLFSTRSENHRDALAAEMKDIRFDAVVTGRDREGGIASLIAENAQELGALLAGDGVFYVCGAAGFAATVIAALESLSSPDAIRTLMAAGRLQQDVFTSAEAQADGGQQELDASEVAAHNDEATGYWTIIDGAVYDVTEFLHRHPGGAAILQEVAGRDGTAAFRQIEHHLDPEVEAMLPMYRLGKIRRLDFGRRGAVAVRGRRLGHVQLGEAFRAWVRYLHLVVEVQNAVRLDFAILDAVTVGDDDPDRITFLKAQLLLEAHSRFTDIYLQALLGDELRQLWAWSTAFVAPHVDVRELHARLEACYSSVAAATALAAAVDRLRSLGAADPGIREAGLSELAASRDALERANIELLAALKADVADGVRLFELHGRDVPERADAALLAPLNAIPSLLNEFYSAVATGLSVTEPRHTLPS